MGLINHIKDRKLEHSIEIVIIGIIAVTLGGMSYNFGPNSRRTLIPSGKIIEYNLPADYKRIINASSGGSEGDMILTYENLEGKVISEEYDSSGLSRKRIY